MGHERDREGERQKKGREEGSERWTVDIRKRQARNPSSCDTTGLANTLHPRNKTRCEA